MHTHNTYERRDNPKITAEAYRIIEVKDGEEQYVHVSIKRLYDDMRIQRIDIPLYLRHEVPFMKVGGWMLIGGSGLVDNKILYKWMYVSDEDFVTHYIQYHEQQAKLTASRDNIRTPSST